MGKGDEETLQRPRTGKEKLIIFLKGNLFIFLMVLAIAVGVGLGMGLR